MTQVRPPSLWVLLGGPDISGSLANSLDPTPNPPCTPPLDQDLIQEFWGLSSVSIAAPGSLVTSTCSGL